MGLFRLSLKRAEHTLARELGLRSDPQLEAARRARLKALSPRVARGVLDLSSVPDVPADRLTAFAESLATDVKELAAANSRTVATYPLDAVRHMPLEQLDTGWREAQAKIWPASAFARKKVRKLLQTYADNGAADPAVDFYEATEVKVRCTLCLEHVLSPLVGQIGGASCRVGTLLAWVARPCGCPTFIRAVSGADAPDPSPNPACCGHSVPEAGPF